jgi:TP901 family phage tail tape measure protein
MPTIGNLKAIIGADTHGFVAGMGAVGAAIASAAAASAAFAAKFSSELTKVETLVGVNATQVGQWRGELLALAPAVGQGPKALAEALFVVTSAGERGAAAMDILTRSAMAAAVGMGETKDIARTVTAAMQAYQSSGMTAARATDVLVATVREGNLEASALAGSLGRVMSVASAMGVSLEEVGAFVATFTRQGVSAEEAVTSLRATLKSFIAPGDAARKAMRDLGTSAEELRASIRERGLTATLQEMVERAHGNVSALQELIPEMQALAGVLGTAGTQGETFAQVLASIESSQGTLQTAFSRTAEEVAFKWQQVLASIQVAAIRLGDMFLAPLQRVLDTIVRFLGLSRDLMFQGFELMGLAAANAFSEAVLLGLQKALLAFERFFDTLAEIPVIKFFEIGGLRPFSGTANVIGAGRQALGELQQQAGENLHTIMLELATLLSNSTLPRLDDLGASSNSTARAVTNLGTSSKASATAIIQAAGFAAAGLVDMIRGGQGIGGFFSGLLSLGGGILSVIPGPAQIVGASALAAGALLGAATRPRTQPVSVESFGPQAQSQLADQQRPQRIQLQIIDPRLGTTVREIEWELNRRSRRDANQRLPGGRIP